MKKLFTYILPVMLLVLLAGCPIPFASFDSGGNGAGSGDTALSADQINDSLRSLAGDFTFETLLPVQVRLDIELYDTDAEGYILPEPLPPGSADIHVSFTDTRGDLLYSGKVSADGTLSAAVYLPSAPENVTLALQAAGFEDRSVEIRRMVAYREINRTMAMKRLPPDQRSAARSATGFDSPYPDSVINVPIVTVAYEDLYGRALAGDADYNDFIASYSISETLDDEGRVISIDVQAEAVRKWAGYDHRFGIRIDTYEGDASVSGTYINGSGVSVSYSDQYLQAPREIVLFERSSRAVGKTAAFTITFDTPQVIDPEEAVLSRPPYNPYIYVHNTTRDIHLIDRQPLSASTNPDPTDRFVDDDGYPWALLVPSDWESPAEGQRIEEAYPRFDNWRISGGSEHGDWYNYPGEPWVEPEEKPELLLVEDIRTGSSGSAPSNLMVYNGALYFSADDGLTGRELWSYDETSVAQAADINPSGSSTPNNLAEFSSRLVFQADDGSAGRELWTYNGSTASLVAEINAGGNSSPNSFAVLGSDLYFSALGSGFTTRLFVWNGIDAPALVGSSSTTYPGDLQIFNSKLYYRASNADGSELWSFDGSIEEQAADISSGSSSGNPSELTVYDSKLYFRAAVDGSDYELWVYNGVSVEEIIINSTGASSPKWFTEYGGSLYFSADGGSSGVELWRYGGSGSPVQVADIAAGAPGSNPSYLTVFDGRLYFAADDGSHGVELWSFDGTDAELVADIHPEGSSVPEYLTVYGEGLYFSADNGSIGKELWVVQ